MPKRVERCVEALKKKGVSEDDAWAICKSQYGSEESELADRSDEEDDAR